VKEIQKSFDIVPIGYVHSTLKGAQRLPVKDGKALPMHD
jgi:hypothetical protein